MEKIKKRIVTYWDERAEEFAALRIKELRDDISQRWEKEIFKYLPEDKNLKILDIGTGSGYFALLLSQMGYHVTGIDLTEKMIEEAKKTAKVLGSDAQFLIMDAEEPDFPEESFDVILTRNLTWTLPHPRKAYKAWKKLLKKGGILLNFDADYGKQQMNASAEELPAHHAHQQMSQQLKDECENIKESLRISGNDRPAWDLKTLKQLGYHDIQADTTVSERIYLEQDEFYNPAPLFALFAHRP